MTAKPARTDGERLDWWEQNLESITYDGRWTFDDGIIVQHSVTGVRELIDAAIQAEESQDD